MLQSLSIRNFAIIKAIDLQFKAGVSIFTGETGAGKSILMDALNIVLGARASLDFIRSGEESFYITAVFDTRDIPGMKELLHEFNLESDDITGELIISRRLDRNGRGQVQVNGMATPLRALTEISSALISIHGQYDSWKLLKPEFHLKLLDDILLANESIKDEYSKAYIAWQQKTVALKDLRNAKEAQLQRLEKLKKEVAEITSAKLQIGEDEQILKRLHQVENAEKITENIHSMVSLLSDERGAQDCLAEALRYGMKLLDYDSELTKLIEALKSSLIQIEETVRDLESYLYNLEFSPEELLQLQERDTLIYKLKNKYGETIEEILAYNERAIDEIEKLEMASSREDILVEEIKTSQEKVYDLQNQLNHTRMSKAKTFCHNLELKLRELSMPNCRLEFVLEADEPNKTGVTRAEFLFSANPGEPLKPLSQIASGGELSRFSLAIKSILAEHLSVPTLVLDEVDVGISGNAAIRVGKTIRKLGEYAQILCITHMAQTAAIADTHYALKKRTQNGRTETVIEELTQEEHFQELAHMLEGDGYSAETLATAKNLSLQMK